MTIRVAVLLASYNGEPYIREQMLSILHQEGVSLHIFVRDDGSTDRTRELVESLVNSSPNITLLPAGERTGSPAGNFLWMFTHIDLDGFSHVSLADQDDIWSAQKLKRALERMEIKSADGYSSDLISYSVAEQKVHYLIKSHALKPYDYLLQGASAGCTYVITRDLAKKIRDKVKHLSSHEFKKHSHDWLIYAIARSAGRRWVCDSEAHVFYRQHSTNVYGSKNFLRDALSKYFLIRSGWYRTNIIWLRQFLQNDECESSILRRFERWSWIDRWYVVFHATRFRRRLWDGLALAFLVFFGVMK